MPQSCNLRRPNQFPKNAACQFALIGLLGCPALPIDIGCLPRPMPCGVTKPPTRLLFLIERLPMARHRPALDSTGTAPDRRQLMPNFSAVCELLLTNERALCLFTATRPARPHGCAGTPPRTPPILPTGATVSRYTRSLRNRPASASSIYGSNLTTPNHAPKPPFGEHQALRQTRPLNGSRALGCWAAHWDKIFPYSKQIILPVAEIILPLC